MSKIWECTYTLDCKYWQDKSVDYWESTGQPSRDLQQRFWDKIHPGGYTVLNDFVAVPVSDPPADGFRGRLIERIYKS